MDREKGGKRNVSFLDLAGEIRNLIYKFSLCSELYISDYRVRKSGIPIVVLQLTLNG